MRLAGRTVEAQEVCKNGRLSTLNSTCNWQLCQVLAVSGPGNFDQVAEVRWPEKLRNPIFALISFATSRWLNHQNQHAQCLLQSYSNAFRTEQL